MWNSQRNSYEFDDQNLRTLSNQAIQVLVVWSLDTQIASADVVDCLVIHHEGTIGMLQGRVSSKDGVVWLNDGGSSLRSWINTELQLDLLTKVNGETLHE